MAEVPTPPAPVLRTLSEEAWLDFVAELDVYRSQGGTRPLRRLLVTEVREVVLEMAVALQSEDLSEEKEQEALAGNTALFAPRSIVDCYDRFRSIVMEPSTSFLVEDVLKFNLRFARMVKLCAGGVVLSDSRLRDLYVRICGPRACRKLFSWRSPPRWRKPARLPYVWFVNCTPCSAHWSYHWIGSKHRCRVFGMEVIRTHCNGRGAVKAVMECAMSERWSGVTMGEVD